MQIESVTQRKCIPYYLANISKNKHATTMTNNDKDLLQTT